MPEPNVKRASEEAKSKEALLKELAKLTKPKGPSSRGEADEE
jgi:hypothetical protein